MQAIEQVYQAAQILTLDDKLKLAEWLTDQAARDSVEARRDLIMRTMGSMAGLIPSSDQILAERHAETIREESLVN